jgi:hypothetical protein
LNDLKQEAIKQGTDVLFITAWLLPKLPSEVRVTQVVLVTTPGIVD